MPANNCGYPTNLSGVSIWARLFIHEALKLIKTAARLGIEGNPSVLVYIHELRGLFRVFSRAIILVRGLRPAQIEVVVRWPLRGRAPCWALGGGTGQVPPPYFPNGSALDSVY